MPGGPYCSRCHTWMYPRYGPPDAGYGPDLPTVWVCECPVGEEDRSKDPNCHNPSHDHYDPESPIVLSRQAEYEEEEDEEPEEVFNGVGERPFFEVIDELDEILEDTNQQAEEGFVAREGPTDRPGGLFEGPKHECGGCNMKDAVIKEQKRLLADLVLQAPPSDVRREAERWLRLNGKIRAWGGD